MASFPYLATLLLCIHFCNGWNMGVHKNKPLGKPDVPSVLSNNVEKINSTMCTGNTIPYQYTRFPNILGHRSQEASSLEARHFFAFTMIGCSAHLGPFVCSVYFPPVIKEFKGIIPPCRSLCKAAKQECKRIMNEYHFEWPTQLACGRFPRSKVCFDGDSITGLDTDTEDDRTEPVPEPSPGCQMVSVDMCKDKLPYKMTSLPNALGHPTQRVIIDELYPYNPAIQTNCSDRLQDFLCSLHLPECRNDSSSPVGPCRSLCLEAMAGCRKVVATFSLYWFHDLDCNKLPESGNCYAGLEKNDDKESDSKSPHIISKALIEDMEFEEIELRICQNTLPYRYTRYPNILGKFNYIDSKRAIQRTSHILWNRCPFICSVYFSPPLITSNGPVPPCRSLCEAAKQDCQVGVTFPWPELLACENFPTSGVCFDGSFVKEYNQITTEDKRPLSVCQEVRVDMCKNILPYKMTSLPNALGHPTQSVINETLYLYNPITETKCSDRLQDFLCSVHLPECPDNDSSSPVGPCRSLCLEAMAGCRNLMRRFGLIWLYDLDCDKLPESGNCYAGLEKGDGKETAHVLGPLTTPSTDQEDPDNPTSCTIGNYNCRHATSRVSIDRQMTCCFDERLLHFLSEHRSDGDNRPPSCECLYPMPTPPDEPASCRDGNQDTTKLT